MDVPTHQEILGSIDAFLRRHPEIGEARFGRDATGEPGLISRLRKGSSPTIKILDRIKAYMLAKDSVLEAAEHVGADTTSSPGGSSGKTAEVSADARAA